MIRRLPTLQTHHFIHNEIIELCTINRPFNNLGSKIAIYGESGYNAPLFSPFKWSCLCWTLALQCMAKSAIECAANFAGFINECKLLSTEVSSNIIVPSLTSLLVSLGSGVLHHFVDQPKGTEIVVKCSCQDMDFMDDSKIVFDFVKVKGGQLCDEGLYIFHDCGIKYSGASNWRLDLMTSVSWHWVSQGSDEALTSSQVHCSHTATRSSILQLRSRSRHVPAESSMSRSDSTTRFSATSRSLVIFRRLAPFTTLRRVSLVCV